jgi:NAD(P)-dependent dehydrogenase (short-subunit alcohol dehydrogenase family)
MMSQQQVALISGGAQGIGRGMARRFLDAGWWVVLFDADQVAGEETATELAARGIVRFAWGDVADEGAFRRTVGETVKDWGGLDALVNNAGIMIRKPLSELSLAEWNRVLAVNLTGAFFGARECAPHLAERRGAIVNIASTRALMSEPDTESYSASKGGLVALTHALAISLGPAVRVNCISPGWIDVTRPKGNDPRQPAALTPEDHAQHPAGRVGTPRDVAELALYLASPASSFVTGQNFVVDGGMTRRMIYR